MDAAAFAAGHGWPVGKTPAARSAPSRSEGAAPRVCSLWLLSLAQARESNSAARMADETHKDVSRSSRSAEKGESKRERKSEWIRAFARMTESWQEKASRPP